MISYSAMISGSGYEWVNGYLREKPFNWDNPRKEVSFPQQGEEAIHIQFAKLDEGSLFHSSSSYEKFLLFANNNGSLTHIEMNYPTHGVQHEDNWHASYHFWKKECYLLNLTRKIYLATKEHDVSLFKKLLIPFLHIYEIDSASITRKAIDIESTTQLLDAISRVRNKVSSFHIELINNQLSFSTAHNLYHNNLPKKPNIYGVIHALLGSIINEKMTEHKVTMTMEYLGEWKINVRPETLIAYMWALLAEEVSGKKDYKQCRICGEWEDRTGSRKDWVEHTWCGSRMRMREYRERQKKKVNNNA